MQVSMPGNSPAQRRTRARALFTSAVYFKSTVWAFLLGILSFASHASTGEVTLAWNPVADERVALYELHYGQQSGQFDRQVDSTTTTATVTGLTEGQTYYFAVNACDEERTLCSAFSNEVSTTLAVTGLSASFSADPTMGVAPLTANFTDHSSGEITNWLWDFGDGTQSASQSPSHVYMEPGTYTVSLTISGPGGSDTQTQTDLVDVGWSPPVADFSVSPSLGWAPLVVTFSDGSSGNITDWLWNFGDGSTSTATDAIHQYDTPGSYTVALTVTGPGGSDAVTKSDVVVVTEPPPTGISKAGWSLLYVDSEELVGEDGAATNAFDDDPNTLWHTEWNLSSPPPPHEIQIDLGSYYDLTGFRYLPRQDGGENGRIEDYELYVSMDGVTWGSPVATGVWANDATEKEVLFSAVPARYVSLVGLSEVNGNPWTSMAELNVLGSARPELAEP